MSTITSMPKQEDKLSFVDMTKPEKRFDNKVYNDYVKGLTYSAFLSTPYESETCPVQITLDTPHNPMMHGQFNTDYFDTYTFIRVNTFGQGGTSRIYMQDVPAIIEALTKAKKAYDDIREAGIRDFPKIAGYEEWLATQSNNDWVCEATALH